MIYIFNVYNFETPNIGKIYNQYMEMIGDDDWAVLMDTDTMFLTPFQPKLLDRAIREKPDAGMFTCYTNRVAYTNNLYMGAKSEEPNILKHRKIAEILMSEPFKLSEIKGYISGFMMCLSKKTWQEIGPFRDGFYGVDDSYGLRVQEKKKLYRINNLYVFHLYRMGGKKL